MFAKPPLLTIDSSELAAALGIPKSAILRTRAGLQDHPLVRDLPAPLMTRPRLVWLRTDIEAWIDSRRTFRPDTPAANVAPQAEVEAPRKRGRPRNTARVADELKNGSAA